MTIQELLKDRNKEFDMTPDDQILLFRHKDDRCRTGIEIGVIEDGKLGIKKVSQTTVFDIYQKDNPLFLAYQSNQKYDVNKNKPSVFHNIKFIVSFIGYEKDGKAATQLVGVFENKGEKVKPRPTINNDVNAIYELVELKEFKDLVNKQIKVDWVSYRSSKQYFNNTKEVI